MVSGVQAKYTASLRVLLSIFNCLLDGLPYAVFTPRLAVLALVNAHWKTDVVTFCVVSPNTGMVRVLDSTPL